jgi:Na+-transporting NADH:ubiquinone oxidoreductase subunit B
MNIRKILDTVKKPFSKGEKFEKYAPAVNAFYLFLITLQNTERILEMLLI